MTTMTTRKLTISALVIAAYIVILSLTQSFSFGAYQIRIATSLYALAYIFPFLVIPMGLANLIANALFGGLGLLDMLGGCGVGMLTTALIVLLRRRNASPWLIIVPITLVPALCVSAWLSYLLHVPYRVLVVSLMIGQFIPAIVGAILVQALERRLMPASDAGREKLHRM